MSPTRSTLRADDLAPSVHAAIRDDDEGFAARE
jgi:hypothetical protein